METLINVKFY